MKAKCDECGEVRPVVIRTAEIFGGEKNFCTIIHFIDYLEKHTTGHYHKLKKK